MRVRVARAPGLALSLESCVPESRRKTDRNWLRPLHRKLTMAAGSFTRITGEHTEGLVDSLRPVLILRIGKLSNPEFFFLKNFPMDLGIPPLRIKNLIGSKP